MNEYQKALTIRERMAPDSLDVPTLYVNIGNVLYDVSKGIGDSRTVGAH